MSRKRWDVLRGMVDRWSEFSSQAESGYALTFDDYLNDLDLRRLIDEHLREIEAEHGVVVPKSITIALGSADQQFRRATTLSAENVWGVENERENGWSAEREWYYYRRLKRDTHK